MRRGLLYIVYGLLIIGLVAAIVIGFRHKTKAPGMPAAPAMHSTGNTNPYTGLPNATQPKTSSTSTATKPSVAASSPAPTSTVASGASSNGALVNTGPGQVGLLFAGSVIGGTSAAWYYQRRKVTA